jgi:hypothetical protein
MFNPRKGKLSRIHIELLEPRRLLSGHGWSAPAAAMEPDVQGGREFEHANFESYAEQHGNWGPDSDWSTHTTEVVARFPVLVEIVQDEPQPLDFRLTLIETVVQLPNGTPSENQGTPAPQIERPAQQTLPPPNFGSDTQGATGSQAGSPTGQSNNTPTTSDPNESVEIIIHSDGGKVGAFLLHAGQNFALPPGGATDGISEQHPPTLLPAGPTAAPHAQPGAVPAFEPALPAGGVQAVAQPAAPVAPAVAVLTPLAMQPSGTTQIPLTVTPVTPPSTNVVTAIAAHETMPAVAPSQAEISVADASHTSSHWLGPIAAIAPGLGLEQPGTAVSGAVQLATGAVQPAATIMEKAGELIANPLPQDSLPAAVTYNFIRFDATAFHDAASVFAADLAAMTSANIEGAHSHTRAWLITGAVLGFDAAFLAYWYRRGKREREKEKLLTAE